MEGLRKITEELQSGLPRFGMRNSEHHKYKKGAYILIYDIEE
jgi:hypothetical protein